MKKYKLYERPIYEPISAADAYATPDAPVSVKREFIKPGFLRNSDGSSKPLFASHELPLSEMPSDERGCENLKLGTVEHLKRLLNERFKREGGKCKRCHRKKYDLQISRMEASRSDLIQVVLGCDHDGCDFHYESYEVGDVMYKKKEENPNNYGVW